MSSESLGITETTNSSTVVMAGPVREEYLLIDSAVAVAPGQVVEWDATGNNYQAYTSGSAAERYAVINSDTETLSGDKYIRCIVEGQVFFSVLDATAQADDEIKNALGKCNIYAMPDVRV